MLNEAVYDVKYLKHGGNISCKGFKEIVMEIY